MKISEDTCPVTYLKARADDLLAQVNATHRPVIITQNGEARAVLQEPESYERMRAATGLLKLVAQREEDVRAGRVSGQEQVFARLEKKLATGGKGDSDAP
jgi:prevent-host-death family protein